MNFDIFAKNYRNILDKSLKDTGYDSGYFAERKIVEISRNIKSQYQRNRLNILDLGCGDGLAANYLRKYFPNSFITGLDISQESIDVSLKRNIKDSEFKVYDGRSIPYNNQEFDIILLAGLLHHLPEQESKLTILKECHRVLYASGSLFIFEHNPFNPLTLKIVRDCPLDKDIKLISVFSLKKLLEASGFNSEFKFIIFFPAFIKKREVIENYLAWIPFGGQYYTVSRKA